MKQILMDFPGNSLSLSLKILVRHTIGFRSKLTTHFYTKLTTPERDTRRIIWEL